MKRIWDADELTTSWSLSFDDLQLLKTKPPKTHLGFLAQLKHYQCYGKFLQSRTEIADAPLDFLAEQLDTQTTGIETYDFESRSSRRHRKEILSYFEIEPAAANDKQDFTDWLIDKIYPQGESVPEAEELGYSWFLKHKVECPAKTELTRLSRSAFNRFERNLHIAIARSLSAGAKEKMDLCGFYQDRCDFVR